MDQFDNLVMRNVEMYQLGNVLINQFGNWLI